MPRFTGYNAQNIIENVRAQTPEAKNYVLPPLSAFDFWANDVESPGIRSQLTSLSSKGVTFQETAGTSTPKMIDLGAPAAAGANAIHAAVAATVAAGDITTGFTNPDVPRNMSLVFALNWDGGNIIATGTDQYDNPITETFTGASNVTRTGTKIFKTVTKLTKTATGVQAVNVTIGTGVKLGIVANFTGTGIEFADGVAEAASAWDATLDAVTATTAPNGTHTYKVIVNV